MTGQVSFMVGQLKISSAIMLNWPRISEFLQEANSDKWTKIFAQPWYKVKDSNDVAV